MRSKILALLLCFCLLIPAAAEARELPASDEVLTAFAKQSGFDSLQGWIDESLSASVGAGAENVVLAAAALHPELDFSVYVSSALEKLSGSASSLSPATVQYIIHVLSRLGAEPGTLSVYVPEEPEEKGIMSLIYAIHLADDGIIPDGDKLREKLLSLRHSDGGWSIFGEVSDVDVTAMALQALSGEDYEEASKAAFDCLASKQLEDGGFKSFGEENCESLSQVILALVAHGYDP
ncbi:MAG: terpene cyclase/mutase family protein [Clostridia bacterium]|nr:terpene cyclase/mutase family protein [Clostridia bacterium]